MDEYGCYRHTKEDATAIGIKLAMHGTIVFPWSHDQHGAHIVLMAIHFKKLGIMPFGGKPDDRIYVGIYGKGCGHLSSEIGPHHNYTDEKLNLDGEDGKKFAEFYGWIIESMRSAQ